MGCGLLPGAEGEPATTPARAREDRVVAFRIADAAVRVEKREPALRDCISGILRHCIWRHCF